MLLLYHEGLEFGSITNHLYKLFDLTMAFLGYTTAFDDLADMMCGLEEDCLSFYYGIHVYIKVLTASDCATTLSMDMSDRMSDISDLD